MSSAPPAEEAVGPAGPGGGPLTRRAGRALGWSFLNSAVTKLGTLGVGIALARMLGPEEFGAFAVALVALMAVLCFNELGVSLAVVRWRSEPSSILPTVNLLSLVSSALLLGLLWVTAPAVATALGEPDASGIIRLVSVSVLFSGAVAGPAALLQRQLRQGRRMAIDQVVTWTGNVLSLVLAAAGVGAWSLAWGRVVGTLVGVVLFIAATGAYRVGLDVAVARRLLAFGLPLAAASMVVFAVSYVDQIAVGSALGATTLGYFVLAYNLASWPVTVFSQSLRSVAPAVFARLQGAPDQMRAAFEVVAGGLLAVSLPVCLVLSASAEEAVEILYGAQWAPAAPILRVLALAAAARILFELAYDYLVVLRRSSALLVLHVVWLAALAPAVAVAAWSAGAVAVAAAELGVAAVVVLPLYLHLLAGSGVRTSTLLRGLLRPTLVALAAAAVVALTAPFLSPVGTAVVAAVSCTAAAGWGARSWVRPVRAVLDTAPDEVS